MYFLATLVKDIMAELVCLHLVDCFIHLQWRGGGLSTSCPLLCPDKSMHCAGLPPPESQFLGRLPLKSVVQFPCYGRPTVLCSPLLHMSKSRTRSKMQLKEFPCRISAGILRLFQGNSMIQSVTREYRSTRVLAPPLRHLELTDSHHHPTNYT